MANFYAKTLSALCMFLVQFQANGGSFALATPPEIHPDLLQANAFPANIFITLRAGTDAVLAANSAAAASFASVSDQRTALHAALQTHARETQRPLLGVLQAHSKSEHIISFWITNQIYVRGVDESVLDHLRHRDDVSHVAPEAVVQLDPIIDLKVSGAEGEDESDDLRPIPFDVEYNLEIIRATDVWANDVNGTGIVVANIDTGVRATHQALRGSYKDDDYSWFDPVTGSTTPVDDNTHGTMCMGLVAGGLEIGVAFGAQWIACKGLDADGLGYQAALLSCGEFILCPTLPDGSNPDCAQAPRIVSNSWNSADAAATWYNPVINAWQAGGIIPVWSAGNYGERGCASLGSQAPYGGVIAVGSTNEEDRISWFSSLGPGPFDENDIKPDIGAPGEAVRSAHSQQDNTYGRGSGTSFAAPHVAGVIALLLSMDPELGYAEIQRILESTAARDLGFSGALCGAKPDSEFPNFHFGHGRLDALAVYDCAMDEYKCLEEPPTTTTTVMTTTTASTTTGRTSTPETETPPPESTTGGTSTPDTETPPPESTTPSVAGPRLTSTTGSILIAGVTLIFMVLIMF